MLNIRLFIATFLTFSILKAQEFVFTTRSNDAIVVCSDAATHEFTFINYSGSLLSNLTIQLLRPTGIEYVSGSLVNQGSNTLSESQISGDTAFFYIDQLSNTDSLRFSLAFKANTEAITFQNEGNIFRNEFTFFSTTDTSSFLSTSYNILAPSLSILSFSPSSQTIVSGGTTNRTFQIVNAGNGYLSNFYITESSGTGLTLNEISIGTINSTKDTIFLEGSDFLGIGDNDSLFETNEQILFTESLYGYSCTDITVSSELTAIWGCEGQTLASVSKHSNISIDFNNPSLSVTGTESLSSCFSDGVPSTQSLQIINTGSGMASSLAMEIYKSSESSYDQTILSKIDTNSLEYKTIENGNYIKASITSFSTTNNSGDYACLGSSPIGKVMLSLPDMLPGDTLWLRWEMLSCCMTGCTNQKVKGWKSEISYSDVCANGSYSKSYTGQASNSQQMALFTETKPDITSGESYNFNYRITSFTNTLPQFTGAYYELLLLPDADLSIDNLSLHKNGVLWTPAYQAYSGTSNLYTYRFELPAPFDLSLADINFNITGDCGTSGWKDIHLDINYLPDSTCNSCEIPLICNQTIDTYLHCPGNNCESLQFYNFTVTRQSLGLPDNNQDGIVDASGSLDMSNLKLNRMMVKDTFQTTFYATVHSSISSEWNYAYASSTIDEGQVLELFDAELTIYDANTSQSIPLDSLIYSKTSTSNSATFLFDLSIDSLTFHNSNLNNYSYSDGDSIQLTAYYTVSENINSNIKEVTSENDFHLSQVSNPSNAQKEYCDFRNGRFTLISYEFENYYASNYTVNSCSKTIQQDFSFKIGGLRFKGNFFPYEYRNWATLKTAKLVIPENYSLVKSDFWQYRTKKAGYSQLQKVNNITPDIITGDSLSYDLSQYYTSGQIDKSTDGFIGRMRIEIAPACNAQTNTYKDLPWTCVFTESDFLGAEDSPELTASPDRVRYKPSSLVLSSNNPQVDSYDQTVEWHLKINNNSNSDADYSWINIRTASNMWVEKIIDQSTGDSLVKVADLFQIGTISKNKSKNYTIFGRFNNCETNSITVNTGYQCDGYPSDFQSFSCGYTSMNLYQYPAKSEMQVLIFNDTKAQDLCSTSLSLGWEIASVNLANIYEMSLAIFTPDTNSIRLENTSSQFLYNLNSSYETISSPSLVNDLYTFTIANYASQIANNGMPGSMDLTNNRLRLKTNFILGSAFQTGDYILITIKAKDACNEDLPDILLAYDPNSKFTVDNTAGINLDQGEHWSAAWGDYNGDGYDDLFVPNYSISGTNLIYQNNGDGTFTKITNLAMNQDLGSAVSGTWGDYDNDGNLDLFVTYNTSSENKLYRNMGNGSFESIQNDPAVVNGIYSHGAAWADYDRDGYLDLAVSDYWTTHFNELYHNNGDGTFSAMEASPITMNASSSVSLSWADFDNDNDPDLFIANNHGENNKLFINQNGTFQAMESDILVQDGGKSVGGSWGDYDNDGDLDIYVCNSGEAESNSLYENNGNGSFTKITIGLITNLKGFSHGASWIDYDNDGDLDLLVANDQNQENWLFANNNDKTFTRLHNAITQESSNSYGIAWADADMDGDYDLFMANKQNTTNDFFWNEKGACKSYLGIKLIGGLSNKNGIGARIRVKATIQGISTWQMREVSSQNNGGPGGQNSLNTLFGLDEATIIDSVEVHWPSGIVQLLINQVINQYITIVESPGSTLCGTVYYDENQNEIQDQNEVGLSGYTLKILESNHTLFTDANGNFQTTLANGDYTIQLETNTAWTQDSPIGNYSISIDHTEGIDYCGLDFGLIANCDGPELSATIQATALKRGFQNELKILVENNGTDTALNLSMHLELTGDISLIGDSWDSYESENDTSTYIWNIASFPALSDSLFALYDYIAPTADLDSLVSMKLSLTSSNTDCDNSNNESSYSDLIVGSIDPNDKAVFINNGESKTYIGPSDTLHYRIRFQNIGNYPATIVRIVDTLNNALDPRTIEMVSSSHPFTFSIQSGNILTWENTAINLVDSFTDPEGSNGQIIFSIQNYEDAIPGTVIKNTASIQFDYNESLATNTTINVVRKQAYANDNLIAQIHPNPTNGLIAIQLRDKNTDLSPITIKAIRIRDIHGHTMLFNSANSLKVNHDCSDLIPGVYLLELQDEVGRIAIEKLIVY